MSRTFLLSIYHRISRSVGGNGFSRIWVKGKGGLGEWTKGLGCGFERVLVEGIF